jgi:hypothetical protein
VVFKANTRFACFNLTTHLVDQVNKSQPHQAMIEFFPSKSGIA